MTMTGTATTLTPGTVEERLHRHVEEGTAPDPGLLSLAVTELADLRAIRDRLSEEKNVAEERMRRYMTELRDSHRNHEADVAMIGERLIAEADRRDWCEEYDQIVADLNGNLHVSLPDRKKAYTVTISGNIMVPFSYEIEVEEARDEEHATEQAQEQFGYSVTAEDLLAYHSDSTMAEVEDSYNLEYEAEEA